MNCSDWPATLGYHCAALGGDTVVITTPHRLATGQSVPVVVEPYSSTHARLSDGGELLFWALSNGIDLKDGRRLKGVSAEVRSFGAELSIEGELSMVTPRADLPRAFASFVQATLRLVEWHDRLYVGGEDEVTLVDRVGEILLATNPNARLERDPEVMGLSRLSWTFAFRQADTLIDCIGPSAQSSAAEVRKLLDVRSSSPNLDAQILVIVDDRADPARAKREIAIVSRLADAVPFTAFASGAPAAPGIH